MGLSAHFLEIWKRDFSMYLDKRAVVLGEWREYRVKLPALSVTNLGSVPDPASEHCQSGPKNRVSTSPVHCWV